MAYLILCVGIIIIIYSLMTINAKQEIVKEYQDMVSNVNIVPSVESYGGIKYEDIQLLADLKEKADEQLNRLNVMEKHFKQLVFNIEKSASVDEHLHLSETELNVIRTDNGKGFDSSELHEEIYKFYDQGVPLVEIAKQLGRGKGEIKLVLGLRS